MENNYAGKSLNTQQFVEAFGTEIQKKQYAKTRKLPSNTKKSVLKTAKQEYEVTSKIEGGKAIYQIGEKKVLKEEREDKRITNGKWSDAYTKNMDLIVVSELERNWLSEKAQPLSKWLIDFGLISPKQQSFLKAKYNDKLKHLHLKNLKELKVIKTGEEPIFDDYVNMLHYLKGSLLQTLNRMRKVGIIELREVYKGLYCPIEYRLEREDLEEVSESDKPVLEAILADENKKNKMIDEKIQIITPEYYMLLSSKKKEMMNLHNVGNFQISKYKKSKKVKSYNEQWNQFLRTETIVDDDGNALHLKYFYRTYQIILRGGENEIIRYLEKYNKELLKSYLLLTKLEQEEFFNDNKMKYVENLASDMVKKADRKAAKFLSPKVFVLDDDIKLMVEFGVLNMESINRQVGNTREQFMGSPFQNYYDLYFDGEYSQKIAQLEQYCGIANQRQGAFNVEIRLRSKVGSYSET